MNASTAGATAPAIQHWLCEAINMHCDREAVVVSPSTTRPTIPIPSAKYWLYETMDEHITEIDTQTAQDRSPSTSSNPPQSNATNIGQWTARDRTEETPQHVNEIGNITTGGGTAITGSNSHIMNPGGTLNYGPVYYLHPEPKNDNENSSDRIFKVPIKPSNRFVSRDNILEQIREALSSKKLPAVLVPVVLKGTGGMGKSELMLHYCYQYREKYRYVIWLNVDGRQATLDAFRTLASYLGINFKSDEPDNEDALVDGIRRWFESQTGWLLLLDNMDNAHDVHRFIPATGGDVFITTRNHVSLSWATVIEVDKMTNEQALHLLLGTQHESDNTKKINGQEIVDELGCFPLAINLARSYVETTKASLNDYLKLIMPKLKLLRNSRDDTTPNRYQATLATVWNLSFSKIMERNSLATRILRVLAFLRPDEIPASLFHRQHGRLALFVNPVNPVHDILSAIDVLVEFSFVRRTTFEETEQCDMLGIHRLMQAVVRSSLKIEKRRDQLETIIAVLNNEVVSKEYHVQVRITNEVYIPHVRHVVAQLKDYDPLDTEFQDLLVRLYESQGIYDKAEPMYQRAEHPKTILSRNNLANLHDVLRTDKSNGLPESSIEPVKRGSVFKRLRLKAKKFRTVFGKRRTGHK